MQRSPWMSDSGFKSGQDAEQRAKAPVIRAAWMSDAGYASGLRAAELTKPAGADPAPPEGVSTGKLAIVGAIAAAVLIP
ncbi:hypothetical protein ABIC83_002789 [Roseateles asaccharophilus]|uniref:hypothetical protein n=1 Tax=Roseateles asaccharophilus TaxID=582607 RepID=UPI0038352355